jgi:predicted RNase H-like HicB family nuclease
MVQGRKKATRVCIRGDIKVIFLEESRKIVAFAPALDLATSADTLEEARRRFEEILEIFFEETLEKGTLEEVLAECGWRKVSRPRVHWVPPKTRFVAQEDVPVTISV